MSYFLSIFLFHSSAAASRFHERVTVWWSRHSSCKNGGKCYRQI